MPSVFPDDRVLHVVRSLTTKAPHCECGDCRLNPGRSTQFHFGFWILDFGFVLAVSPHPNGIRKFQFKIQNLKSKIKSGPWQKGVCTSLSTKTMTVRVRSVPPFELSTSDFGFRIAQVSYTQKSEFRNHQSQIQGEITYVCTHESQPYRDVTPQLFLVR